MAEQTSLRVMVVDDSTETREYLRQLLHFESNVELVGLATNGQEAVNEARKNKPDVILMDINMPVMDGISATEIIYREMPGIRVVMMSVQGEMAYLRRAMQVGAREFLVKPFDHDELMNILGEVSSLKASPQERAAEMTAEGGRVPAAQPANLATVVSVFSPRGGAGCSTLALNLAIALQGQRKAQVLLIDGNLRFGALDAMLNLQISRSITDLTPSLAEAEPDLLHDATLPHTSGIRLLAAPPSPEMADLVSLDHLQKIITLGRQRYDYIVVDVGSHLDDRALTFMDVSEQIFVLLTPDIPAVKNTRLFLGIVHNLDYESDNIKLILNKVDPRGGITAEAIERHIKYPVPLSIPDKSRLATAAINRGVPLILYEREADKSMPVTRQFLALTEMVPRPGELAQKAEEQAEEEPARAAAAAATAQKKGILGKLFGLGK
jgi:pilus assembly protein CpaE